MRKSFFSKAIVAVGVMASAMALSGVATFAADKIYNFSNADSVAKIKTGTYTYGDFTLTASVDDKMKIDENAKEIDDFKFTKRLSISKFANGYLSFTTSGPADITIYGMSGKSNNTRYISLYKSGTSDTLLTDSFADNNGNAIGKYTYSLTDANGGTYKLSSKADGYSIYYIKVSETTAQEVSVNLTAKDAITNSGVSGFTIKATDDSGNPTGDAITATEGVYSLQTLTTYAIIADNYATKTFTVSSTDTAKEISLTPNSFPVTVTAKDSITGNSISGFTVSASGTPLKATSGTTYSLAPNTTYTLSADGYDAVEFTVTSDNYTSGKEVTLNATGVQTYTLSNSDIDSTIIVGDQVKDKFLICNYTKQGSGGTYIQVNENSGVMFKTTGPAKLTFSKVKQGGSGGTRILVVKKADGTVVSSTDTTSEETPVNVDITEAGTYYILGNGTTATKTAVNIGSIEVLGTLDTPTPQVEVLAPISGKAGIAKVDNEYYALAVVTADEADKNSAVKFNDTAVEEIYKEAGVSFTNNRKTVFDPALLGGSGYVVGIKLDVSDLTDTSLATLQDKVAVTLEAME